MANLAQANLWRAKMAGDDLREAYLVGARLTGVDLTGADLRGSEMRETNLSGAVLLEANLDFADLQGAKLSNTLMPNGQRIFERCSEKINKTVDK